ncbi:peptide-methionine (S)-S-oxide reductase [Flavobacteriaceae bacterium MAR_2010_188]|nr:peptide-methionine (S)-S-oxide reductase [Flavobacteriaceae bacterium MAR_2010_188]
MKNKLIRIGLGGGCHWCTEAVFKSLMGVEEVKQGYIASTKPNDYLSEGIIIDYDQAIIPLEVLIKIHLLTHKSSSEHSMREKYRSAIYYFYYDQKPEVEGILQRLQLIVKDEIITTILPFKSFESSREEILDYFYKNPDKPFCQTYIQPKLKLLIREFSKFVDSEKLPQSILQTKD